MHKFHCGLTETAAGPAIGAIADLGEMMLKARDSGLSDEEQFKFSELFNWVSQNTPWANLTIVRPTLDYLFLHSIREIASPGAHRRELDRRRQQYGQSSITPQPLDPFNLVGHSF